MLKSLFVSTLLCLTVSAPAQEAAPRTVSATLATEIRNLSKLGDQQRWFSVLNRSARLLETHKNSPELLLFQAAANKELGRNEESRAKALEFLERFPDSVNKDQGLFLLGEALLLSGSRVEAASVLLEASRVSNDPTLRKKIQQTLPPKENPIQLGLSLGGKPPSTPEEIERTIRIEERIIEIAVKEFTELHGRPPELMGELLQGHPPILKALPEDPRRPGRSLPFKRPKKAEDN